LPEGTKRNAFFSFFFAKNGVVKGDIVVLLCARAQ